MTRSIKAFEHGSKILVKYQSFVISLILVVASFSYLFLVNRYDFSIKETNVSLVEAQSILSGEITLPERLHDTALYNKRVVNIFQPGQTIFFLAHLIAEGGNRGVGIFQVELFLVFVLSVFLFSLALYRLSNRQAIF